MEKVNTVDLNVKREVSDQFVNGALFEAFGGRVFGWRRWDEFQDRQPDERPRRIK